MRTLTAIGLMALVVAFLTPMVLFAEGYSEPSASQEHSVCRPILWDFD
jgi:hypothetical protein